METEELMFINGELRVCEAKVTTLTTMLSDIDPADKEVVDFLKRRRDQWIGYRGALLYVRDHRPDAAVRGTVEV